MSSSKSWNGSKSVTSSASSKSSSLTSSSIDSTYVLSNCSSRLTRKYSRNASARCWRRNGSASANDTIGSLSVPTSKRKDCLNVRPPSCDTTTVPKLPMYIVEATPSATANAVAPDRSNGASDTDQSHSPTSTPRCVPCSMPPTSDAENSSCA